MASTMLKVRTGVRAGDDFGAPQMGRWPNPPQQYGWWWMDSGYIARPGRPVKAFGGWYYGAAPQFYSPGGFGGAGLGAGMGGDAPVGDGTMAPPAP